MDKKIKFANIFNNNTYDPDKDDDEDAYDISPADILIQDIDLKRNYNSRYRFYTELLKIYNKNPKIIKKVYTKLNAIKDLNGMEKKLLSELIYYNNKLDKTTGGSGRGNRSSSKSDRRDGGGGGDGVLEGYKESKLRDVLKKDYDMPNISKLNKNINEKNPNSDKDTGDKITDFNNQIDKYYDDIDIEDAEGKTEIIAKFDKDIKKKIIEFENDPENTFNYLELTIEDRLVFIITTFFIRYLSLILIQWSVDIY